MRKNRLFFLNSSSIDITNGTLNISMINLFISRFESIISLYNFSHITSKVYVRVYALSLQENFDISLNLLNCCTSNGRQSSGQRYNFLIQYFKMNRIGLFVT